ncbi:MAG: methyl-accepting chemotaxis protein [bacterium]|nr:methyl-accepting chemotaxis protein [bacterium]
MNGTEYRERNADDPAGRLVWRQALLFLLFPLLLNYVVAVFLVHPHPLTYQHLSLAFAFWGISSGVVLVIAIGVLYRRGIGERLLRLGAKGGDDVELRRIYDRLRRFPLAVVYLNVITGLICLILLYTTLWFFAGISVRMAVILFISSALILVPYGFVSFHITRRNLSGVLSRISETGVAGGERVLFSLRAKLVVFGVALTIWPLGVLALFITAKGGTDYDARTVSLLRNVLDNGAVSGAVLSDSGLFDDATIYYIEENGVLTDVTTYDNRSYKTLAPMGDSGSTSFFAGRGPASLSDDTLFVEDAVFDAVMNGESGVAVGPMTERVYLIGEDKSGRLRLIILPLTGLGGGGRYTVALLVGFVIIMTVAGFVASLLFGSMLRAPINEMAGGVGGVSYGKPFRVRKYFTLDEIEYLSANLAALLDEFNSIAGLTRAAAEDLDNMGRELNSAVSRQASGANSQASAITQTSTTLNELSRTVSQTATKADDILTISDNAINVSESSSDLVHSNIEDVRKVDDGVNRLAEVARSLSSYVERIEEISEIVDGFAEQTSILSINAAIEAGRAGDEGLGFSAVAREVKALAESFQEATGEIEIIVGQARKLSEEIILRVQSSAEGVHETRSKIESTGEQIEEVVNRINEVGEMARAIAGASREQSQAIDQAATAVEEISAVASQNAAGASETKNAASRLTEIGFKLREAIEKYKA